MPQPIVYPFIKSIERSSSHKPVGQSPERSGKQSRQAYKAQQITLHSLIPISFQQIMYRMSSSTGWTRDTCHILKQAYINTATVTRIANPYPPTQTSHNGQTIKTAFTHLKIGLQLKHILRACRTHNQEPVYNSPNAKATTRNKFKHAQSHISNIKTVYPQGTSQQRND